MVVRFGPGIEPGWLVAAVGVGLEVVGWYQISGQPTEAQQLPYLASATIPGAALIVAGAVLIAGRRDGSGRADRDGAWAQGRGGKAAGTGASGGRDGAGRGPGVWALPDGTYLHRGDCPLLDGKPEAFQVGAPELEAARTAEATDSTEVATRPCPICEPDLVAAP